MAVDISFKIYEQVDPAAKTPAWANLCISNLRMNWRPLVDTNRSRRNKSYLLGTQSMDKVVASFKDKDFKETTNFEQIDVMFSIRNSLTEELIKNPPKAELKATDPTAISDRAKDITMLKSRKVIEGDISKYNGQVGLPPYKLPHDKFNGNVQDFDDMGLDENDPDDINFYTTNFQRLAYETAGQQLVNNVFKLNRFDQDTLRKFVIDIMADNVLSCQSYVDKITGEIKQMYIYPEVFRGIFSDSNDGHNDICKGWEDSKTISEFLQLIGNEFDWDRDWTKLLFSLNFANQSKYTGFRRSGIGYSILQNETWLGEGGFTKDDIDHGENLLDWSLAYTYKVSMGFVEWNTCEATTTALYKKDMANPYAEPKPDALIGFVPYSYELGDKHPVTEYQKVSDYQQQWYSSYYIQTSSLGQWIFGFGKVYLQNLEGANDEYASGTLKYYILEGKSAAEIAAPFIDFVNFAYYKTLWLVYHAKPEEDQVVLEELIAVSKGLQKMNPQNSATKAISIESILTQLIKFERENFVRVRSFPMIDGRSIGQLPQLEGKRNGIDNLSQQMIMLMQWVESQIQMKLGINQMRLGGNPQARESFDSTQATLQSSMNTTGYIYRTIQFLKERMATTALLYAQDIIQFKESIPYKWLTRMLGFEQFTSLRALNNVAAHRFGIFFGDYNSAIDKQNVLQAANMALQQKMITMAGWGIITQTEDPKLGFKILAYLERKGQKKAQQQIMNQQQAATALADQNFQNQLKIVQEQNAGNIQRSTISGQATETAATTNADAKIQTKRMDIDAEPQKQAAKAEGSTNIAFAEAAANSQKPFPEAAGE